MVFDNDDFISYDYAAGGAGRVDPVIQNGTVLWKYEYHLAEHPGNVRVVFAAHSHPATAKILNLMQ